MAASASPASSSSSAPSRRIASSARSAPSSAEAASSVSPSARSPAHAVPSRGGAGDPAAGEPHRAGRREACFVRRHGELDEAREDDATTKTRRVDSASLGARLAMRGGRGHDAVAHMLLFSSAPRSGALRFRGNDKCKKQWNLTRTAGAPWHDDSDGTQNLSVQTRLLQRRDDVEIRVGAIRLGARHVVDSSPVGRG
jgi:hypothetical protein